jgi:hypothetical protein
MAESVKRRVAAARLAVAFVAAGTIAGATWASANPPPPQAESSAADIFSKHKIDSGDIKNGTLLFQDFKRGEVLSNDVFVKYKKAITDFKQDVKGDIAGIKIESTAIKGELGDIKSAVDTVKGDIAGIKGELSSYLKHSDSVIRGDGSVLTSSVVFTDQIPVIDVPGLVSVVATDNSVVNIKNNSGAPLTHSQFGNTPAGTIPAGSSLTVALDDAAQALQLIGPGATPQVATLSMSSIESQITVQILIGL